ncbi:unnamed protein product [Arabidopsis thaliana]|uniref:Uncharacterized protein n=1 Tax=Arabidopsis thaliana TaxID=3702 RepID=A0A654EHD7_ARATH|nr:unnamed protein product [Arabidopsis thaliana]
MDSRRKSSFRARRSSVDNEEVAAIDMSSMTERQIRQARHAQRSSSIQGGSSSRSAMQREEVAGGKRIFEAAEEHQDTTKNEDLVNLAYHLSDLLGLKAQISNIFAQVMLVFHRRAVNCKEEEVWP